MISSISNFNFNFIGMADNKRSKVWDYFEVSDNVSMAKCEECETEISRGGSVKKNFNTTNLLNHLKRKHPRLFQSLTEAQQKAENSQTSESF